MYRSVQNPQPTEIRLNSGAQAVINGALVTAVEPSALEVGSGGFVLTGRSLWPDRSTAELARELYLLLIEASMSNGGLASRRRALFNLLGRAVAQLRTHEAQSECSLCAAAILSGDLDAALGSARRLMPRPADSRPHRSEKSHPTRLTLRETT